MSFGLSAVTGVPFVPHSSNLASMKVEQSLCTPLVGMAHGAQTILGAEMAMTVARKIGQAPEALMAQSDNKSPQQANNSKQRIMGPTV